MQLNTMQLQMQLKVVEAKSKTTCDFYFELFRSCKK